MKLRVVGWVCYDDDYPQGEITWAARNAVIDDIREHDYVFSGWAHQEGGYCTPFLSDGKAYCWSQRGWGDVMAEAHHMMGPSDYAKFAFPTDSRLERRPEDRFVFGFRPEADLSETFECEVSPEQFLSAKNNGEIHFDNYEDYRYVGKGDKFVLTCGDDRAEYLAEEAVRTKIKSHFVLCIKLSKIR